MLDAHKSLCQQGQKLPIPTANVIQWSGYFSFEIWEVLQQDENLHEQASLMLWCILPNWGEEQI